MKRTTSLPISLLLAAASSLNAAVIFSESFDYGSSDIGNINANLANYSGSTGVIDYDADGGLTSASLNEEAGGALFYNFATSGSRSTLNTDAVFDPFPSAGAGDTFWIAGLIQYNTLGQVSVLFQNGQSVNRWGFGIDASGNVLLRASDNGGAEAALDTGADAAADGSTYLFLSRATLGSGTSPTASTVDFWFNPADTSSIAALGSPTFSTGADSKIGRDSGAYTGLTLDPGESPFARIDEIRFGEDLVDAVGVVPEPSAFALLAGFAAFGGLLLRRRLRR